MQVVIFSHHPWVLDDQEGQEQVEKTESCHRMMPRALCEKWLPKMRHQKIKYLFAAKLSPSASSGQVLKTFKAVKKPHQTVSTTGQQQSSLPTCVLIGLVAHADEVNQMMEAVTLSEKESEVEDDGSSPITPSADWKELPAGTSADDTDTDEDQDNESKEDNVTPHPHPPLSHTTP